MSENSFLDKEQESILIVKDIDDIVDCVHENEDKNFLFSLSFYNQNPKFKKDLLRRTVAPRTGEKQASEDSQSSIMLIKNESVHSKYSCITPQEAHEKMASPVGSQSCLKPNSHRKLFIESNEVADNSTKMSFRITSPRAAVTKPPIWPSKNAKAESPGEPKSFENFFRRKMKDSLEKNNKNSEKKTDKENKTPITNQLTKEILKNLKEQLENKEDRNKSNIFLKNFFGRKSPLGSPVLTNKDLLHQFSKNLKDHNYFIQENNPQDTSHNNLEGASNLYFPQDSKKSQARNVSGKAITSPKTKMLVIKNTKK